MEAVSSLVSKYYIKGYYERGICSIKLYYKAKYVILGAGVLGIDHEASWSFRCAKMEMKRI